MSPFQQFKVLSILQDRSRQRNIFAPPHSALIHKKTFEFSTYHIWRKREGGERMRSGYFKSLSFHSNVCWYLVPPWPKGCCIVNWHYILHSTELFIEFFFHGKTGSGETFCRHCCCCTINKDWQRNENNRNRFILLSTIHLLQLQWWFLSNSPIVSGKVERKISSPPTFLPTVFATRSWGWETSL